MDRREELFRAYLRDEVEMIDLQEFEQIISVFSDAELFCRYFKFDRGDPKVFYLDYPLLVNDTQDQPSNAVWVNSLRYRPDYFLSLLKSAIHWLLEANMPNLQVPFIQLIVAKYDVHTPLASIRSAIINKFVMVSGTIVKVSQKKPFVVKLLFECSKCHTECVVNLPEGKYTTPRTCSDSNCKNNKHFKLQKHAEYTVNWRRIKVQETPHEAHVGVPLTVDCEARGIELAEVAVGDPVTVLGIVRAETSETYKSKHSGLYGLYIEIITLITSKKDETQLDAFTPSEIQQFHELSLVPGLFYLLIKSFCTMIFGHEKVKAGLLLALLGGNDEFSRGNSHVLVVGDPGLGKTQLIRTAAGYSARGVYISATTKSGLTVNFSRENGQHVLKAGALLMADEGVCAIAEFDKMGKEQEGMLEVMEQQTITVAKAGIYSTLRAKTTILAAANPCNGHYNPTKTLAENLRVNSSIITRFDLIFLLLDCHASEVSKHVISMHGGVKRPYAQAFNEQPPEHSPIPNESFSSYVKRACDQFSTELPSELMKQYLAFARASVNPRLSTEAAEIINAFYVNLRREAPNGSLPVTARQIYSLKRLTEARARAELRDVATQQDAIEVLKLFQETIFDLHTRNFSVETATRRTVHTKPIGQLSAAKQQMAFVERLHESGSEDFSYRDLVAISKEMGLRVGDFNLFIERLNLGNVILKRPGGMYKLVVN